MLVSARVSPSPVSKVGDMKYKFRILFPFSNFAVLPQQFVRAPGTETPEPDDLGTFFFVASYQLLLNPEFDEWIMPYILPQSTEQEVC